MAVRGTSRQELIRRRRLSGLVGRQGEQSTFQEALKQSPEDAPQFLFHIHGPAGVGKSTLLRHLQTIARDAQALTAFLDESATDPVDAMTDISSQFAQQGVELKRFDKLLSTYRQRRHEADAGAATSAGGSEPGLEGAGPSASSVIASQLGLVGLGMIPGVGPFAGAVDPNRVALGADRVKAVLSGRLRSHEDVELVASPLKSLTPVFLQDLGEAARRRPWLVLFFDTYERTGPLLDMWLRSILVSDQYGQLPANVLVVLAGQSQLDARCWGDWVDLITDLPLNVFTDTEARQLLTAKGVTDERVVEVILKISGCLPVLVSTLAESRPTSVNDVEDPSGTAVERFLKWESDPTHRAAALACALPDGFDEDIYLQAVDGEGSGQLFNWLRSMPFVTDRAGQCRYHDVVRDAMLRLQRKQSPARWKEQHTRLADAFRAWCCQLEGGDARGGIRWADERWRSWKRQETYHRLCADHRIALPRALRELLDAHDHDLSTLRRWVQTLSRAANDADASIVRDWGDQLLAALEEPNPGFSVLTLLLSGGTLDAPGQSLALTMRAWEHRKVEDYGRAVADYTTAICLHPTARAFRGRGECHRLSGCHDEALIDFNRAIELEPEIAWAHVSRGQIYYSSGQYEDALIDLNKAIELDPRHYFGLSNRGLTYHAMGRYEEAVADFTQAIAVIPEFAWAFINRGRAYELALEYEDALSDFDRAIEIDPENAWAFSCRGGLYHSVGRYEEALSDFSRSAAIDPDNAFYLTHRALTYRFMGRIAEALSDLTHVIELHPAYTWAVDIRARIYSSLGRSEEALDGFTRAIELEPGAVWPLCSRGHTYRLLGRLEESLADFERALQLDPSRTFALTNRGVIYRLQGEYDKALADFDRVVELDPGDGWNHYEKAVVLHALRHEGRDSQVAYVVGLFSAMSPQTIYPLANLFLLHCLISDWREAERYLASVIGGNPSRTEIVELTAVMNSLEQIVQFPEAVLTSFRDRLEVALVESRGQLPS
ncbi:tetratricopeptide repeat protein [Streptomyces yangpuensis]|uniref:tetratricopeptide repeat protein n=1 Tax=Streptomyces yangpuensis TaxID=1648182 RepID=UPI00382E414A